MRVTINVDDEVLESARALARARGCTLGQAVSLLARRGLGSYRRGDERPGDHPFPVVIGEPGTIVTDRRIANLRDG